MFSYRWEHVLFFVCGEDDDTPSNGGVSKMLRQAHLGDV